MAVTIDEVRSLLAGIRVLYGRGPRGPDAEQAWQDALRPADIGAVRKAWTVYQRQASRPPSPADLLRIVRDTPQTYSAPPPEPGGIPIADAARTILDALRQKARP